jgi:hypothetical protein
MRLIRRNKSLWLVAVFGMLGLLFPAVLASGSSTTTGSTLPDGGYLNLHFPDTNTNATFTQYSAGTTVLTGPQSVTTATSCGVNGVNPGSPDLAKVTSSGGTVGAETSGSKFVGLGVKGSSSSGTNCGRVEPGESLTVALGSALKLVDGSPAGSSLLVTAAELDIDAKGNALIRANLFAGGTSPAGFALLSSQAPSGDSGPDATSGDNFAFPINAGMPACSGTQTNPTPPAAGQICGKFAPFSSVTLSTSTRPTGTPSFALEGGRAADPRSAFSWDSYDLRTATPDSVFRLQQASGILDCGHSTGDVGGSGGTPIANVTRLANDSTTCTPIAYRLQTSTNSERLVSFQKDLSGQPDANFTIKITWPSEPAQTPVPVTQIDFGTGYHDEQWCNGTTTAPELPGTELWCLEIQHTEIVGDGMIQITETSFGHGDPNVKRT